MDFEPGIAGVSAYCMERDTTNSGLQEQTLA
jgi:hypothetical protein